MSNDFLLGWGASLVFAGSVCALVVTVKWVRRINKTMASHDDLREAHYHHVRHSDREQYALRTRVDELQKAIVRKAT